MHCSFMDALLIHGMDEQYPSLHVCRYAVATKYDCPKLLIAVESAMDAISLSPLNISQFLLLADKYATAERRKRGISYVRTFRKKLGR